jgi:hypothetical protein
LEPSKPSETRGIGKFLTIVFNCSAILRTHLLTRENAWVMLVAFMLLLILVLGTMGVQPKFVYSGF